MEIGKPQTRRVKFTLPKQILFVVVIAVLGGLYPMSIEFSWKTNLALIIGMILSTLNAIVGSIAFNYSLGKSDTVFMKVVMGGMVIRLFALLGLLLLCIVVVEMPVLPLVLSTMGFHLIYLVLELLYIHFNVRQKNMQEG